MFCDDLACALRKHKLTVPTLAAMTDLSPKYLYNLLNGDRKPSTAVLATLDRTLHFPVRVLTHFIRVECATNLPVHGTRIAALLLTALALG